MNEFTEAMRQLAAGVAVVTVRDGRDDIGTTVTTFCSLSADPPMVLLSLTASGYLCEVLLRQDRWAASLLSGGQAVVASRFATPGRPSARLLVAGTPHHRGRHTGAFVLDGGVAALEAETARVIPAGDHTVFLAQVLGVDYVEPSLAPLVRMRGRYRAIT
ncbi:reductase [Sphaerisporangium krabiense]|uniref:Flavin reductase (DIM6/NTAB) family NADH-FMN oxidoreductase RutF n=1 Tax=Sphaerisporangium krabiense TaxID=763782 RepID=A0A7W8Z5B2_9ACTN|nr:flavin reductase family protein [Sphaerisporangium krabiense]MBB5627747.1 flavin reductase (DIM6/NTAB) family NADH-FMN oxidoreductase RutF [Sphaerisporangium krabiense]GII61905.1 reductase [Sphaerisporangium krabiense]